MDHLDWVGYLIPAAIVIFTLLRRGGGAIKRAVDAAATQAAGVQRGVEQLRLSVEAQQRQDAEAAAAARTPAGRAARLTAVPGGTSSFQVPAAAAVRPPPARPAAPRAPSAPRSPQSATIAPVVSENGATAAGRSLQDAFRSVAGAQQAVILAEILGKPVALR